LISFSTALSNLVYHLLSSEVKIKLMAKSLFFCGLIFLLFSPSAFPWQIAPFQQVKDFAVEKEKNQMIMKPNSTVKQAAEKILKGFSRKVKKQK